MYSNNVQVPHEFFKKSKNEYYDWQLAFFRELIQNSVDAGASRIDFHIEDYGDGTFSVRCIDNGHGMSKDIIINKLLCLGGSHKKEGSAGGFGYAKTLLFFAHEEYVIHSKNQIVRGSGGSFDISDADKIVDGANILVILEEEKYESSVRYFERKLKMLINYSSFNAEVFLNGEELEKNFNKFDFNCDTPIGRLKFNDSESNYSELWIRVNGIPMFRHTVYSAGNTHFSGVIELNRKSTDVMTSNRDSLKDKAAAEFEKVFNSLQNERGSFKSSEFEEIVLNEDLSVYSDSGNNLECDSSLQSGFSESVVSNNKNPNQSDYEPEKNEAEFNPFKKLKKSSDLKKDRFKSFMEKVESGNYSKNFVVLASDSVLTYAEIKNELNKYRSIKLAKDWEKIVKSILYSVFNSNHYMIEKIGDVYFYNEKPIMSGFHFSNSDLAVNASSKNGYKILINPLTFKEHSGNLKNNKLIDLAIHEITHIFNQNHDERFCSIENDIKWIFYEKQNVLETNIERLIC